MKFDKEAWTTTIELPVRWGDMDAFDHVNNTIYFRYFESVRIEYFMQVKWGWDKNKNKSHIGPILAHTSCQFIQPVRHPDNLTIAIRAKKLGNSSLVQEYAVYSDKLGLAASGESVVVCFDYQNNTKVNFPDDLRNRIKELEKQEL